MSTLTHRYRVRHFPYIISQASLSKLARYGRTSPYTEKETEALSGNMPQPRSHGMKMAEARLILKSKQVCFRDTMLFPHVYYEPCDATRRQEGVYNKETDLKRYIRLRAGRPAGRKTSRTERRRSDHHSVHSPSPPAEPKDIAWQGTNHLPPR